jgi:hypothetical protein
MPRLLDGIRPKLTFWPMACPVIAPPGTALLEFLVYQRSKRILASEGGIWRPGQNTDAAIQ